jgi:hypothetical protein
LLARNQRAKGRKSEARSLSKPHVSSLHSSLTRLVSTG